MKIPVSQGRVSAQPALQQHTPMTGLSDIGRSIGGALESHDQKIQEQEVSAKRLELYGNQLAEQDARIKLDDTLTTEMSEHVTNLKNDVSNGVMKAADANANLQKWSQDRYKQLESEMPLHAQKELKQYWDSNIVKQSPGFLPLEIRATAQKSVQLVDRAFDIATRYENKQGEEYLESFLNTAEISEAAKGEYRQKYKTTRNNIAVDSIISNAISGQDTAALHGLITDLDNGKYPYLDGQTAQHKKSQALSRIDAIEKQQEVEENKRKSAAGKVFNEYKAQVLTGRMLDDDYIQSVETAVKGTENEADFQFYRQQSTNFQNFSRKSTSQMLDLINQQKVKMKSSKTTDAVAEQKVLDVYENLYKDKVNTLKDNPNQVVRELGLNVHNVKGIELQANPKSFASKVIDNGLNQLSMKDSNIKLAPISKEDLPEAKEAFEKLGINQKLNFIGELVSKSNGVKGGQGIWNATLKQLGGGDLSYVMAGVARKNNFHSTKGEDVATAIISGTQALKNKHLIMPKDELLNKEFNQYVGNSVSGETSNMTFAAFKSLYAHLSERDNYQHKDKEDINPNIAHVALGLATGGVYEQSLKYGNQRNWKVSKPYGMEDAVFKAKLSDGYKAISHYTGISVNDLESLRLRRSEHKSKKDEIQYDLVNERGAPLVVKGTAWRINLKGVTK